MSHGHALMVRRAFAPDAVVSRRPVPPRSASTSWTVPHSCTHGPECFPDPACRLVAVRGALCALVSCHQCVHCDALISPAYGPGRPFTRLYPGAHPDCERSGLAVRHLARTCQEYSISTPTSSTTCTTPHGDPPAGGPPLYKVFAFIDGRGGLSSRTVLTCQTTSIRLPFVASMRPRPATRPQSPATAKRTAAASQKGGPETGHWNGADDPLRRRRQAVGKVG